MDSKPATWGRHVGLTGAPQLAATADRAAYLQVYSVLSRGCSNYIIRDGPGATALHPNQTADPLSHVFILRALRETAQICARSGARVSGENWRSLRREASFRFQGAHERRTEILKIVASRLF